MWPKIIFYPKNCWYKKCHDLPSTVLSQLVNSIFCGTMPELCNHRLQCSIRNIHHTKMTPLLLCFQRHDKNFNTNFQCSACSKSEVKMIDLMTVTTLKLSEQKLKMFHSSGGGDVADTCIKHSSQTFLKIQPIGNQLLTLLGAHKIPRSCKMMQNKWMMSHGPRYL